MRSRRAWLGLEREETNEPTPLRDILEALDLGHQCGAWRLNDLARAELIACGYRARQSRDAQQLFVTEHIVELHLTNAYRKLGVGKRTELTPALGESP